MSGAPRTPFAYSKLKTCFESHQRGAVLKKIFRNWWAIGQQQNNGWVSKEPLGCLVHLPQKDTSSSKVEIKAEMKGIDFLDKNKQLNQV